MLPDLSYKNEIVSKSKYFSDFETTSFYMHPEINISQTNQIFLR